MSNKLRALVADVENRITQLAAAGGPQNEAVVGLSQSWALLVAGLDLPAEQKLRACPACKRDIQRAATLCGYCWTRVEPVH